MVEPITTVEELERLPLGQWILDADGQPWVLIDTNVMVRQRMWRDKRGHYYVSHSGVKLPATLVVLEGGCDHVKLNVEGWQCARCGHVVNEPPPPPEEVKPEPGRAWFLADHLGDWVGMSPDFDNIIALAEDSIRRPHDDAAHDRLSFEVAALARAFRGEELDEEDVAQGLELIIRHLVAGQLHQREGN